MPKGGARAFSGPAPDPNALRRDRDSADWTTLPAEGRKGKAPAWPLDDQTDREKVLWRREWQRPQALMWERNSQELEVAIYVRSLVSAEQFDASVASRTLLRQQQEALGLSVPGMARNRWRIGDAVAQRGSQPRAAQGQSVRDRFRVVTGDAAA